MTSDEVKAVIATDLARRSGWSASDHVGDADAVIAALAAAGMVIGERVTDQVVEDYFMGDAGPNEGLAIVRVVTNAKV